MTAAMAVNRLSKLQKWILNRALENMNEGRGREGWPSIYRDDIYTGYYKLGLCRRGESYPPKVRVSISRSLNSLEGKGLITYWPGCRKGFILLSEKYVSALAEELKLTKPVNIKEAK